MKNKLKPIVHIICGVFNNLKYTKKFLNCIEKQSYPNINTLIIDDGSTDGTYEYIKKNYSDVAVLKGDGNLWWTGAIYWGVEEVLKIANQNDLILTINNDCTFDTDYIATLVKASLTQSKAIVGSLVIDQRDKITISDAGTKIDWEKGKFIKLEPKYINDLPKGRYFQTNINTLSTRGTLYPIEVFRTIGNFDKKNFPHYLSDYEFACRANKAGYKLLVSYRAKVFNDMKRTGIGKDISYQIGPKEASLLLFSRRSGINIIDNYRFIMICYPLRYRLKNLFFLCKKVIIFFINYMRSHYLRSKI